MFPGVYLSDFIEFLSIHCGHVSKILDFLDFCDSFNFLKVLEAGWAYKNFGLLIVDDQVEFLKCVHENVIFLLTKSQLHFEFQVTLTTARYVLRIIELLLLLNSSFISKI